MRVTVRLFARLRDIAGAAELTRDIAQGATDSERLAAASGEYPEFGRHERSISSAVNADYARMDQVLSEGDEVAFLAGLEGEGKGSGGRCGGGACLLFYVR